MCDLGGGASKVASQWYLAENRMRKRHLKVCLRGGLVTVVGSRDINIIEDTRPAPDWD